MKLLTKAIGKKLIANHIKAEAAQDHDNPTADMDHTPVVKFFTPDANATWLITEYDPDTRMFFGLCDLGMGCPELGYVSRDEMETTRGPLGLYIERDLWFKATGPLSSYI